MAVAAVRLAITSTDRRVEGRADRAGLWCTEPCCVSASAVCSGGIVAVFAFGALCAEEPTTDLGASFFGTCNQSIGTTATCVTAISRGEGVTLFVSLSVVFTVASALTLSIVVNRHTGLRRFTLVVVGFAVTPTDRLDIGGADAIFVEGCTCSAFIKATTLTFGELTELAECAADTTTCSTDRCGTGGVCNPCDFAVATFSTATPLLEGGPILVDTTVRSGAVFGAGDLCTDNATIFSATTSVTTISSGKAVTRFVGFSIRTFTGSCRFTLTFVLDRHARSAGVAGAAVCFVVTTTDGFVDRGTVGTTFFGADPSRVSEATDCADGVVTILVSSAFVRSG